MSTKSQVLEIRDAASIVLIRDYPANPKVLVGQRGQQAVFMPNRFVFPGGAVDEGKDCVKLAGLPSDVCRKRLAEDSNPAIVNSLVGAAVRELFEETGLRLATKDASFEDELHNRSSTWQHFAANGHRPSGEGLVFFFRAVTPPGRLRRFDARFFLGKLETLALASAPDDFGNASDELVNLHWADLDKAAKLNMPFITKMVLATARSVLKAGLPPQGVPFHFQRDGERYFKIIR